MIDIFDFIAAHWVGLLVTIGIAFAVWVAWCCLYAYTMGGVVASAASRTTHFRISKEVRKEAANEPQ